MVKKEIKLKASVLAPWYDKRHRAHSREETWAELAAFYVNTLHMSKASTKHISVITSICLKEVASGWPPVKNMYIYNSHNLSL